MNDELLFVGTHRRAHKADSVDIGFGIYAFRADRGSGGLIPLGVTETPQPGWIAAHPSGNFLYATNEVEGGGVSAFAINHQTGVLELLNTRPTPSLPCHCDVDRSGRFLIVATFGGGTVQLFPLMPDGSMGPEADTHQHAGSSIHPRRQTRPHAHGISIDPGNRFVLVPDLGADQIFVYELDPTIGRLISRPERATRLPPGSGPRHATFDPQGRFVYVINEMNATIATFRYDPANGSLQEQQTMDLLPNDFSGLRSGGEIGIHPKGRFLYATTRSHGSSGMTASPGLDSVVWFEIDRTDGKLSLRGRVDSGGGIPRSFTFDENGDHLLVGHQCSGTIVKFRIDTQTGTPIATDETLETPVPVCLRFISLY